MVKYTNGYEDVLSLADMADNGPRRVLLEEFLDRPTRPTRSAANKTYVHFFNPTPRARSERKRKVTQPTGCETDSHSDTEQELYDDNDDLMHMANHADTMFSQDIDSEKRVAGNVHVHYDDYQTMQPVPANADTSLHHSDSEERYQLHMANHADTMFSQDIDSGKRGAGNVHYDDYQTMQPVPANADTSLHHSSSEARYQLHVL